MGKPDIRFFLIATPRGIGPPGWPSSWKFEHAYNPGHYPPKEFYWDRTTLRYNGQCVGPDGIPAKASDSASMQGIRERARRFLQHHQPYQFDFKVYWDHGDCTCTRGYNEDCPVHYVNEDDTVVRVVCPPGWKP